MPESLSGMRTELLQQHEGLRAKMRAAREAALGCQRGEDRHGELNACIAQLAVALHQHNAREEQLLRGLIKTIDAWGPARAEIMTDTHQREHVEVHQALVDAASAADASAAAATALRLLEDIATHMAREEDGFLGADVLDDGGPTDGFGG